MTGLPLPAEKKNVQKKKFEKILKKIRLAGYMEQLYECLVLLHRCLYRVLIKVKLTLVDLRAQQTDHRWVRSYSSPFYL